MTQINEKLKLPCGAVINNRLCKSAMTEGLCGVDGIPREPMQTLYRRWAEGNTGLLITGNVMIDKRYLERIGNPILENEANLAEFRAVAKAATATGNHCWMQISHPGRQCTRLVSSRPISPSAEQLNLLWFFSKPRAMSEADIEDVIARYIKTACLAQQAGFSGVQFHAAHGYLISQFLSPLTNKRDDQWGGNLENRARLLLTVVRKAREVLGPTYPIGVKLNSKDFQQGGFSLEECAQVARWLSEAGLDLLEISGGSYEAMAFFHGSSVEKKQQQKAESTRQREAFFLKYAEAIAQSCSAPLLITGGFRDRQTIEDALQEGKVQMVGLARPYCVLPDLTRQLIEGDLQHIPAHEDYLSLGKGIFSKTSKLHSMRGLNSQAEVAWFYQQIIHLSENRNIESELNVRSALFKHLSRDIRQNIKRRLKAT